MDNIYDGYGCPDMGQLAKGDGGVTGPSSGERHGYGYADRWYHTDATDNASYAHEPTGNALDDIRSTFEKVVDDVKDTFAGEDRTQAGSDITYNQIQEARPDPSLDTSYPSAATTVGEDDHTPADIDASGVTTRSSHGDQCGVGQHRNSDGDNPSARVARINNQLNSSANSEHEI